MHHTIFVFKMIDYLRIRPQYFCTFRHGWVYDTESGALTISCVCPTDNVLIVCWKQKYQITNILLVDSFQKDHQAIKSLELKNHDIRLGQLISKFSKDSKDKILKRFSLYLLQFFNLYYYASIFRMVQALIFLGYVSTHHNSRTLSNRSAKNFEKSVKTSFCLFVAKT